MSVTDKLLIKTVTKLSDRLPTPSGTNGRVLRESGGVMAWGNPSTIVYATEAALWAASPDNGSIGYATTEGRFWFRRLNQWWDAPQGGTAH